MTSSTVQPSIRSIDGVDHSTTPCRAAITTSPASITAPPISEASTAVLTIRDDGPGIPDYARDKVFDRFYSLRHHAAGRKGTGLGLTLVREAAELHGGSITLEPATPGGTLATLSLPLA